MTLQQLKYAVTTAEEGTISAAAEKLFISQPSLTSAIRELEKEMGVTIFLRTNRGVVVSREGDEFLGYARQVLMQAQYLQERYGTAPQAEKQFSVSSQHYAFAVRAFSNMLRTYDSAHYRFTLRETTTYEIIEDVRNLRSEVGILCLNPTNEVVLQRIFQQRDLKFTELITQPASAYVRKTHPLANQPFVTEEDLAPYPCITYEQGTHNAFYFAENVLPLAEKSRHIQVRERATCNQLLREMDAYAAGTGINMLPEFVSLPIHPEITEHIGYLIHRNFSLSSLAQEYIVALKRYCRESNYFDID